MDDSAPVDSPGDADWVAGMRWIARPHPSRIEPAELLRQCELTMTRRGGPGGQHRNKTSTAVVLHHRPTAITAEASERRSQADNRRVALQRLRLALAVLTRCAPCPAAQADLGTLADQASLADQPTDAADSDAAGFDAALRQRYSGGGGLRVSPGNPDHAAVISLLLDDLVAAGGQPQAIADRWHSSASQILRLLREHPPALAALNRYRQDKALRPLR